MKFGAHNFVFTERWSDQTLDVFDTIAALGLEILEIGVGDDVTFSLPATRRRAQELLIELSGSPGGLWPVACDVSSDDPRERALGLAWHQRQIDLAGELGAVAYTGALYGHPGTVRRRVPPPEERRRAADALHQLAAHGASRGVAVVIEPMSHFRTHIANTPEQVAALIGLSDHPNLQCLLDTYHLITEIRDYAAAVHTVRDRLWGIHACENDRGVPGGGLVPWEAFCAALRAGKFDGYVLLETYNSAQGDFAHQRGMFHNVCPDGYAFARDGIAFMKRQLRRK